GSAVANSILCVASHESRMRVKPNGSGQRPGRGCDAANDCPSSLPCQTFENKLKLSTLNLMTQPISILRCLVSSLLVLPAIICSAAEQHDQLLSQRAEVHWTGVPRQVLAFDYGWYGNPS